MSTNEATITMENLAWYSARFFARYELDGKTQTAESGDFTRHFTRTLTIPAGAENIRYWGEFRGLLQWYPLGNGEQSLPAGESIKCRLLGTAFRRRARWEVIDSTAPPRIEPRIEHVIVLMMENRSFDHMFGFLDHPNPEFERLEPNQYTNQDRPDGPAHGVNDDANYEIRSPGHEHEDVMLQLFGDGTSAPDFRPKKEGSSWGERHNRGFARDYHLQKSSEPGDGVMRCFTPDKIPVMASLAKQYPLCTRWFCSLPGATLPNRHFAVAGTSHGRVNNNYADGFWGRSQPTIFSELTNQNQSWRVYYGDLPSTVMFHSVILQGLAGRLVPDLCGHELVKDIKYHGKWHGGKKRRLPAFTWVEPRYSAVLPFPFGNSHHPGQAPSKAEFLAGEELIAGIHDALLATMNEAENKEESLYAKTLFVIVYDEHGGFYDHVSPPEAVSPDNHKYEDGKYAFEFDLLGPRVPAIVMSPWLKGGALINDTLDHTSINATLHELFDTNYLGERSRIAKTFWRETNEEWGGEILVPALRTDLKPVGPELDKARGAGDAVSSVSDRSGTVPPAPDPHTGEDLEVVQYNLARETELFLDSVETAPLANVSDSRLDRSLMVPFDPQKDKLPDAETRARLFKNVMDRARRVSGRMVEILDAGGLVLVDTDKLGRAQADFAVLFSHGAVELCDDGGSSLRLTPTADGTSSPKTGGVEFAEAGDEAEMTRAGLDVSTLEKLFDAFRDARMDDIRALLG